MLYAILNTTTGRLLKVEAEKQRRCYDWEKPYTVAVLRLFDSPFDTYPVYVTQNKGTAYGLLKPKKPTKFQSYDDLYIEGVSLGDLCVVKLQQEKPGGRKLRQNKVEARK